MQAKGERESVEAGVMRNGTQIKDCPLPLPPLHSFWNGGIEACEKIALSGYWDCLPAPKESNLC